MSCRSQVSLEMTSIGDLVHHSQIFYDPNPSTTVVEEDQELVNLFAATMTTEELRDLSPWLLRVVLRSDLVSFKGNCSSSLSHGQTILSYKQWLIDAFVRFADE